MGTEIRAQSGSPNPGTNGVHIRKKTLNRADRPLRERPDRMKRYSVVPWTVLIDGTLEPIDLGIFACLSSRAFKADTIQMGSRWIAEALCVSKGRVQAGIKRLKDGGHVEVVVPGSGSRSSVYRLTSEVFAVKQQVRLTDKRGTHDTTRAEIDRKIELARRLKLA